MSFLDDSDVDEPLDGSDFNEEVNYPAYFPVVESQNIPYLPQSHPERIDSFVSTTATPSPLTLLTPQKKRRR